MSCSGLCSRLIKNCGRSRPWVVRLLRVPVRSRCPHRLRRGQQIVPPEEVPYKLVMSAGVVLQLKREAATGSRTQRLSHTSVTVPFYRVNEMGSDVRSYPDLFRRTQPRHSLLRYVPVIHCLPASARFMPLDRYGRHLTRGLASGASSRDERRPSQVAKILPHLCRRPLRSPHLRFRSHQDQHQSNHNLAPSSPSSPRISNLQSPHQTGLSAS